MTFEEAQQAALRTDLSEQQYEKAAGRMKTIMPLMHAAMGLCTEVGELQDQIKRFVFYGKPLDHSNLIEEGGDLSWYLRLLSTCLWSLKRGDTFEEMIRLNIKKLKERYPDQFTEDKALNRDLNAEQRAMQI